MTTREFKATWLLAGVSAPVIVWALASAFVLGAHAIRYLPWWL